VDDDASAQSQPGPIAAPDPNARTQTPGAPERYGPVQLERHVKGDGRALLIYARANPADPARA
jgi:hypothetical protein